MDDGTYVRGLVLVIVVVGLGCVVNQTRELAKSEAPRCWNLRNFQSSLTVVPTYSGLTIVASVGLNTWPELSGRASGDAVGSVWHFTRRCCKEASSLQKPEGPRLSDLSDNPHSGNTS